MTGIYSNYLMVSNKLLLIIQIIFSALTASIGNVIVREKSGKRYEVFCVIQSVSFILCGTIVSAFCIMANDFVYVWLGSDFTISTGAILAMTLNTYLSCVLQPLWIYRDATGLYVRTKYVMLGRCGAEPCALGSSGKGYGTDRNHSGIGDRKAEYLFLV